MNINWIPTDSLYKWLSIFGLVVSITSISLFLSLTWQIKEIIHENIERINFFANVSIGFVCLGIAVSLTGFILWYCRLQKHIDTQVKSQAEEQTIKTKLAKLQLERENS